MSVGVLRSSATKPDLADLLARARAIAELARERAQQTEATRRVGDDMIEHMRQADLFRVMQPRVYGGFEYGFDVFAQIVAAIARGCGSTGWVYAHTNGSSPASRKRRRTRSGKTVTRLPPGPMRRLREPWPRTAATGYPAWGVFAAAATTHSGSFSAA